MKHWFNKNECFCLVGLKTTDVDGSVPLRRGQRKSQRVQQTERAPQYGRYDVDHVDRTTEVIKRQQKTQQKSRHPLESR